MLEVKYQNTYITRVFIIVTTFRAIVFNLYVKMKIAHGGANNIVLLNVWGNGKNCLNKFNALETVLQFIKKLGFF